MRSGLASSCCEEGDGLSSACDRSASSANPTAARDVIPQISEFSYGFALLNEIVGWTKLRAAPILPSLIEEGKKGGGYDVKLDAPGIPLYLQFKRADCMMRRTAFEISVHKLKIKVPFYRFAIADAAKSDQHELLLELDDGSNRVFYASPRFHKLTSINAAWAAKEVAHRSIFVRPQAIGSLGSGPHSLAYDDSSAFVCSEPKAVEFLSAAQLVASLDAALVEDKRPLRIKIPEINGSLEAAWERATEKRNRSAFGDAQQIQSEPLPSEPSALTSTPVDVVEPPEVRMPKPLPEPEDQLRVAAETTLQRFEAQLVVVQRLE